MTSVVSTNCPTAVEPMVRVHSQRPRGQQLQAGHRVGVGELARPESDQARRQDAWQDAEDRDEGVLMLELGVGVAARSLPPRRHTAAPVPKNPSQIARRDAAYP